MCVTEGKSVCSGGEHAALRAEVGAVSQKPNDPEYLVVAISSSKQARPLLNEVCAAGIGNAGEIKNCVICVLKHTRFAK